MDGLEWMDIPYIATATKAPAVLKNQNLLKPAASTRWRWQGSSQTREQRRTLQSVLNLHMFAPSARETSVLESFTVWSSMTQKFQSSWNDFGWLCLLLVFFQQCVFSHGDEINKIKQMRVHSSRKGVEGSQTAGLSERKIFLSEHI